MQASTPDAVEALSMQAALRTVGMPASTAAISASKFSSCASRLTSGCAFASAGGRLSVRDW